MFKKVLIYGLPVYLYGLESLMKALASIKADSVAGPTLAGAALSLLVPLTEFKTVPLSGSAVKQLDALGADAHLRKDKNFIDFIWLFFFVSLGAWVLCIYLTLRPPQGLRNSANLSLMIGCIIYLSAVALAELKERLRWKP
jgi:hypothetical protein